MQDDAISVMFSNKAGHAKACQHVTWAVMWGVKSTHLRNVCVCVCDTQSATAFDYGVRQRIQSDSKESAPLMIF